MRSSTSSRWVWNHVPPHALAPMPPSTVHLTACTLWPMMRCACGHAPGPVRPTLHTRTRTSLPATRTQTVAREARMTMPQVVIMHPPSEYGRRYTDSDITGRGCAGILVSAGCGRDESLQQHSSAASSVLAREAALLQGCALLWLSADQLSGPCSKLVPTSLAHALVLGPSYLVMHCSAVLPNCTATLLRSTFPRPPPPLATATTTSGPWTASERLASAPW